jgi:DmsE family decaheme c-type cytochrome
MNSFLISLSGVLWVALFVTRAAAWSPPVPAAIPPAPVPELAASPAAAEPQQPAGPAADRTAPTAPATDYAGQDTCVACHEGFDAQINGSRHGFVKDVRSPAAAQGCESCHGPSKAHSEDPTTVRPANVFAKMASADISDSCTTCHNRGDHALWEGSAHDTRNMSCTTCHSVHTPKSAQGFLKAKDEATQCATCHRDKANKLDRSGHMPVREGKMECTSCHNVHGARNTRLLRAGFTVNESCTSCHAEKRGPMLWEHAPVRDSCVSCHDPHGSGNERMLVAKQPFLCQRCHNHARHPATIYDQVQLNSSNRIFSRSCASCHSQIHGSNHPSGNFLVR